MAAPTSPKRPGRPPHVEPKSEAGKELSSLLAARGVTQSALASSIGASAPYVNQLVTGSAPVPAKWAEIIVSTLNATPQEQVAFYRAAARDAGFKIDLREDESA